MRFFALFFLPLFATAQQGWVSITIQGEHNAVEVQYLDEAYLLDAVCSYIRYRYLDDDCEATQRKLAAAFLELGKSIDSAKAAA